MSWPIASCQPSAAAISCLNRSCSSRFNCLCSRRICLAIFRCIFISSAERLTWTTCTLHSHDFTWLHPTSTWSRSCSVNCTQEKTDVMECGRRSAETDLNLKSLAEHWKRKVCKVLQITEPGIQSFGLKASRLRSRGLSVSCIFVASGVSSFWLLRIFFSGSFPSFLFLSPFLLLSFSPFSSFSLSLLFFLILLVQLHFLIFLFGLVYAPYLSDNGIYLVLHERRWFFFSHFGDAWASLLCTFLLALRALRALISIFRPSHGFYTFSFSFTFKISQISPLFCVFVPSSAFVLLCVPSFLFPAAFFQQAPSETLRPGQGTPMPASLQQRVYEMLLRCLSISFLVGHHWSWQHGQTRQVKGVKRGTKNQNKFRRNIYYIVLHRTFDTRSHFPVPSSDSSLLLISCLGNLQFLLLEIWIWTSGSFLAHCAASSSAWLDSGRLNRTGPQGPRLKITSVERWNHV